MVRRSNVVAALLILVLLVAEVNGASRDLQAEGSKRPKAKPVAPPSTKVDKNCATSVSAGVKKVTDQYQKQVTSLTAEVTSLKKYRSQVGELLKMLLKMKTKLDATNVQLSTALKSVKSCQTELAQVQSENEDLQSQLDNCNQGNTETTTNTNDSTNDNTNDSTNDTGETTADTGSDN